MLISELENKKDYTDHVYYSTTFRISKQTDFQSLKKEACDFWGLNSKLFKFFDETADEIDAQDLPIQSQNETNLLI